MRTFTWIWFVFSKEKNLIGNVKIKIKQLESIETNNNYGGSFFTSDELPAQEFICVVQIYHDLQLY